MKRYLKKFGIMFVMTLILSLGFCISAFADDSYEVGENNFNNTTNNSAAVGDDLEHPEKGWKRYDDSNSSFTYKNLILVDSSKTYKETFHNPIDRNQSYGEVKFSFYGSKLRIITDMWNDHSKKVYVDIDGNVESYDPTIKNQLLAFSYEKLNLNYGQHNVKIYTDVKGSAPAVNGVWFGLDAIDIDDTGYLENSNESIILDHSSMNLNVGDTQELTATTTPAGAQVVWSSSDESVAKYDPTTGKVIAVGEGTCTITATINDGSGLSASCIINVSKKDNTDPTTPPDDSDSKTGATLIINLTDGETKVFDVSASEAAKFKEWYNTKTEYENQITYEFDKTVNSNISVEEDVVHDQVTSYEIRKY